MKKTTERSTTQATAVFRPRKGQVDFTNIRWAPVINCVLQYRGSILVVERNPSMRLYPGCWNGISGFLDDGKNLERKVLEEVREETGLTKMDISSLTLGTIFDQDAPTYKKTWIVHPVLVRVRTKRTRTDWEATQSKWIKPTEARALPLMPGFKNVLKSLDLIGPHESGGRHKRCTTKDTERNQCLFTAETGSRYCQFHRPRI